MVSNRDPLLCNGHLVLFFQIQTISSRMVKFVFKFVFFWNPNEFSVFIFTYLLLWSYEKFKFSYYLVKSK